MAESIKLANIRKLQPSRNHDGINYTYAVDKPSKDGKNNLYRIEKKDSEGEYALIQFQSGERNAPGSIDGITDRDLLEIICDRLEKSIDDVFHRKALGNIKTAIRMLDYSESVGQAVTAY